MATNENEKGFTLQLERPEGEEGPTLVRVRTGVRTVKRGSPGLRVFERITRQVAEVAVASATTYLTRHRRSNTRRRDGWLFDIADNMCEATRKGTRKIRVWKLLDV